MNTPILTEPIVNTVTLSDGEECQVKRLGIFELDDIAPEDPGEFTYIVKDLTGKEHEVPFDLDAWDEPPEKPQVDDYRELEEESPEWFDMLDYQLYQAALQHRKYRIMKVGEYYERVAQYVLANCLEPEDRKRIVTNADWENVYRAAMVPQLNMELIEKTLRSTYAASFQEKDLLKAVESLPKGRGASNWLRKLENRLMIEMTLSEVAYALMPIEERARKVCALFIDDIMSSLELDLKRKEMNAKKKK